MVKFEEELGQTKRPHRVSPSSRFAEAHYVGALEIRTSMKTVCSGERERGRELSGSLRRPRYSHDNEARSTAAAARAPRHAWGGGERRPVEAAWVGG